MRALTGLLAAGVVLGAQPCGAADRLAPMANGVPGYQPMVDSVLKEAFAPDVRLRAIVEPSFSPEYVVGVREREGGYWLFMVRPDSQVWRYMVARMAQGGQIQAYKPDGSPDTGYEARVKAGLPERPEALKLERCEVRLKPALAAELVADWRAMLAKVRPGYRPDMGLDGETYLFSMEVDDRTLAGGAWSPEPDSEPGRLVAVVEAMRDACRSRRSGDMRKLADRAQALRPEPDPEK